MTINYKGRLKAFQNKMKRLLKEDIKTDEALKKYYYENNADRLELKALYSFFFSENLGGCSNCFIDATFRLLSISLNSQLAKKTQNSFWLYAGQLLRGEDNNYFSNANITDEIALQLLKQCNGYITAFQRLPANFEEIAKNNKIKYEIKDIKGKTTGDPLQ